MKYNLPKITVIIPVYNVEDYVAECIESVINQNYENLEIIIVDDGSADKSGDICELYAKKDDRIILIHQENQGMSIARNNALDIAKGEYIGFVDSDDWLEADMYCALYDNAAAPNADIAMCNYYYVYKSGQKSPYSNENEGIKVLEGVYKIAHNIRLSNNCIWNRLYKRHLFDDIRFPEGKTFEDVFVMHRVIDNANKLVLSSKCHYYYRRRDNSITLSPFNLKQMDNVDAYIERHNYISAKYPNLEKTSRKFIFSSVLWGMRKAYFDGRIEAHKEELSKIIDGLRRYDFSNCGLNVSEKNLVESLFNNIESYVSAMNAAH
jgi:glycosyltransferase involved in cell wall biosynthesis